MNIRHAYSTWAATYDSDRNLTRDLDERITREALTQVRARSLLELGCGTGKNTPFYSQLADHVVALDFSEGMIAQAKAKLSDASDASVQFAAADLTQTWPCKDQSVDWVVCNLVLEHITDLGFIFGEATRVLVQGGHFYIAELHPFRQYQGKQATFAHEGEQVDVPAFVHHVSDFLNAAEHAGLSLLRLDEWWHADDLHKPPRLITFLFKKAVIEPFITPGR
ncbi:MAG: class I SAM-dependent methyltransferase [Anaerolineae bacterium]|nr:class I SAM-dependent methyltransferase [Anaerolineae bacterium]